MHKELEAHTRDLAEAVSSGLHKVELDEQVGLSGNLAMDITFKDLSFTVKDHETGEDLTILEPTSGHIPAGKLVCIMGPSGCGKSTLLDMIAGVKTADYDGSVYVNGHEVSSPGNRQGVNGNFRRLTSYVEQQDYCIGTLTVRETLAFTQRLKVDVPQDIDESMYDEAIDMLLEDFGLTSIQDQIIGNASIRGISGGQKRRVTLARGLIGVPNVAFMDEPTSGLSATDTEKVVEVMSYMCHRYNQTMIVVIHQPRREVAELFDLGIILTNKPGRCVYNGPFGKDMLPVHEYIAGIRRHPEDKEPEKFFHVPEGMNAADYLLDVITPDINIHTHDEHGEPIIIKSYPDGFVEQYKATQKPGTDQAVAAAIASPGPDMKSLFENRHAKFGMYHWSPVQDTQFARGFSEQIKHLLKRKFIIMQRDPSQGLGQIILCAFMGILGSLPYNGLGDITVTGVTSADYNNLQNMIAFMTQLAMLYVYLCLANLQVYSEEKDVCVHEANFGLYSPMAFIIASTVAALPTVAISIFTGMFCMYAIATEFSSDLITFQFFLLFYCTSLLGFIAVDSLFQLFAYIFPDAEQAQGPCILAFSFFTVFNGFAPPPDMLPSWLSWGIWISPTYYQIGIGVETFFITGGNQYTKELAEDKLGFKERGALLWLLFIAWTAVCRTIAAVVLSRKKLVK